jgi:hypothetical protein
MSDMVVLSAREQQTLKVKMVSSVMHSLLKLLLNPEPYSLAPFALLGDSVKFHVNILMAHTTSKGLKIQLQ